jgi:hypothetical protein
MRKILIRLGIVVLLAIVFPFLGGLTIAYGEWSRKSDRRYQFTGSSGQAPDAALYSEAVVQVYAARAARWRGVFGVHSWIAYKKADAAQYVRAEVIGWGAQYKQTVVVKRNGIPDQYWYGYEPELLAEIRGPDAENAILEIESLIEQYPFKNHYTVWPGPNSNTFTAHIAREVEELEIDLPPTAIGKDYVDRIGFAEAPSKSGFQFLAHGVFGVTLALEEGIEINLLGATYGVDFNPPALKLPCIGRIGF